MTEATPKFVAELDPDDQIILAKDEEGGIIYYIANPNHPLHILNLTTGKKELVECTQ